MADTLRDRIAAVLKAVLSEQVSYTAIINVKEPFSVIVDGEVDLLDTSDAVIAALGLRRQSDWEDESIGLGVPTEHHRYVTEWTAE